VLGVERRLPAIRCIRDERVDGDALDSRRIPRPDRRRIVEERVRERDRELPDLRLQRRLLEQLSLRRLARRLVGLQTAGDEAPVAEALRRPAHDEQLVLAPNNDDDLLVASQRDTSS
jgi:hypothetical protein